MNDTRSNDYDEAAFDPELEADVLIGRVIDDEADDADWQRFEHLAAGEPMMWQQLALRQHDMARLSVAVHDATDDAATRDLPARRLGGLTWTLALSGWAAVLVFAFTWALVSLTDLSRQATPAINQASLPALSPEQHYERYLSAPYVLGDLQPVVLEVDSMSDGRVALRFIRRIEEVAFLDPNQTLPVDASGELTKDPSTLRSVEPEVTFPH